MTTSVSSSLATTSIATLNCHGSHIQQPGRQSIQRACPDAGTFVAGSKTLPRLSQKSCIPSQQTCCLAIRLIFDVL